jgi:hypothetical protein
MNDHNTNNYNKFCDYTSCKVNEPFYIPIKIAKIIYDTLDEKNTTVALLMKDIVENMQDESFRYISVLNSHLPQNGRIEVNQLVNPSSVQTPSVAQSYKSKLSEISDTYPLLTHLSFLKSGWRSDDNKAIAEYEINLVTNYINLVDKQTKTC